MNKLKIKKKLKNETKQCCVSMRISRREKDMKIVMTVRKNKNKKKHNSIKIYSHM